MSLVPAVTMTITYLRDTSMICALKTADDWSWWEIYKKFPFFDCQARISLRFFNSH